MEMEKMKKHYVTEKNKIYFEYPVIAKNWV